MWEMWNLIHKVRLLSQKTMHATHLNNKHKSLSLSLSSSLQLSRRLRRDRRSASAWIIEWTRKIFSWKYFRIIYMRSRSFQHSRTMRREYVKVRKVNPPSSHMIMNNKSHTRDLLLLLLWLHACYELRSSVFIVTTDEFFSFISDGRFLCSELNQLPCVSLWVFFWMIQLKLFWLKQQFTTFFLPVSIDRDTTHKKWAINCRPQRIFCHLELERPSIELNSINRLTYALK